MTSNNPLGDHAIVLGASMAGLLAARVLAPSYPRVTVVDRDTLPPIGQHRRGVPQDRHLHVLHPRGAQVLEELFPGLLAAMTAHGAVRGDTTGTGRWQLSGHRFRQEHSGISGVLATRPFLEGHVRGAVGELPGVTLIPGHDIVGLATTEDRQRVTGVRLAPDGVAAPIQTLAADLVVDATGRGSRTPRWLHDLGYPTPHEDRLEIGRGYASRTYRLRPAALGADQGVITGATPKVPRGGVLAAIEDDRYILTLSGILGDHPPTGPSSRPSPPPWSSPTSPRRCRGPSRWTTRSQSASRPASAAATSGGAAFPSSCWPSATPCARSTPSTAKA